MKRFSMSLSISNALYLFSSHFSMSLQGNEGAEYCPRFGSAVARLLSFYQTCRNNIDTEILEVQTNKFRNILREKNNIFYLY